MPTDWLEFRPHWKQIFVKMKKYSLSDCPLRKSKKILSGKWKLLLLDTFKERSTIRYGELKKSIREISEKMMIQELKLLVESGLLSKKSYPEVPPRVEYALTTEGAKAIPIIESLTRFGNELQ